MTSPPRVAEAVVRILLPPACREHVLGDFQERYQNPRQYVIEAARTIPLVILSRIWRTTDLQIFTMEAFSLYVSFAIAAWWLGSDSFLYEDGFARIAIPTAVTLLALVIEDAYRPEGKRSPLAPIADAMLAIGFALLSQFALDKLSPELAVPKPILIVGATMGAFLVATVRMLFPPDHEWWRGAM